MFTLSRTKISMSFGVYMFAVIGTASAMNVSTIAVRLLNARETVEASDWPRFDVVASSDQGTGDPARSITSSAAKSAASPSVIAKRMRTARRCSETSRLAIGHGVSGPARPMQARRSSAPARRPSAPGHPQEVAAPQRVRRGPVAQVLRLPDLVEDAVAQHVVVAALRD